MIDIRPPNVPGILLESYSARTTPSYHDIPAQPHSRTQRIAQRYSTERVLSSPGHRTAPYVYLIRQLYWRTYSYTQITVCIPRARPNYHGRGAGVYIGGV